MCVTSSIKYVITLVCTFIVCDTVVEVAKILVN